MAITMAIIIGAGVWGGIKLDEHFSSGKPIFTIICSLLAVFLALYYTIKDIQR